MFLTSALLWITPINFIIVVENPSVIIFNFRRIPNDNRRKNSILKETAEFNPGTACQSFGYFRPGRQQMGEWRYYAGYFPACPYCKDAAY